MLRNILSLGLQNGAVLIFLLLSSNTSNNSVMSIEAMILDENDGVTAPADSALAQGKTLSADTRETLVHLLRKGIGENSLRALRSDMAYIEAWSIACDGDYLVWPPDREIALRFIAHHLWDPDKKAVDPSHGMPDYVRETLEAAGFLRSPGPHAPSTVKRRISSWCAICAMRRVSHPFSEKEVYRILSAAVRASNRPRTPKSERLVDAVLLERIIDRLTPYCSQEPFRDRELDRTRLAALRDRAMLTLAFAAGGRRRSEVAAMTVGDLIALKPIEANDPAWPEGLPMMAISMGRTKTTNAEDALQVYVSGCAVQFVDEWLNAAGILAGPVFRPINKWGQIGVQAISGKSVNSILKSCLYEIGETPAEFSAHGLRAGYIVEAFRSGIPAPAIMEQTLHKSPAILMSYFRDEERKASPATRVFR